MAGVPVPVNIVVKPFGADADPTYIQLPIPIPDQVLTEPGAASFDTGFGPLNMTDLAAGGIPPRGRDMNGILFTTTDYCRMLQAGQRVNFNSDASTEFTGYAIGARLASITTPGRVWENILDGNTNDPDAVQTGWRSLDPLTASVALSGAQNNVVLPGASDYALDIDTTAGNCDISGFVAQRNGQTLYVSNTGANLLQFLALSGLSAADNQIRAATDLALVQNQTLTLKWFSGLDKWLLT
jgi:hypothetical protein